jgi:hypothetical protein
VKEVKMKTNIKTAAVSAGLGLLVAVALTFPAMTASGGEINLVATGNSPVPVVGSFGGTAFFDNNAEHTSGTGVFNPFLTIERNASGGNSSFWEQGYNTDGHTALYMDQQRPTWNTLLRVGDLQQVSVNGQSGLFYAFILDANEPGKNKSLISIDNIRIYTSSGNNTGSVQNNVNNLDNLGTLRWAMNTPGFNGDTWVKLDADQENIGSNSNGGSGTADMIVYVPVTAFNGANATDFLWFYNLNGLKYSVDGNLGAEAGYEEWQALTGPNVTPPSVPDGGVTLAMMGIAITGLGLLRRKLA